MKIIKLVWAYHVFHSLLFQSLKSVMIINSLILLQTLDIIVDS